MFFFVIAHETHAPIPGVERAHAVKPARNALAIGHDVAVPAEGHIAEALGQPQERKAGRFVERVDERAIGDSAQGCASTSGVHFGTRQQRMKRDSRRRGGSPFEKCAAINCRHGYRAFPSWDVGISFRSEPTEKQVKDPRLSRFGTFYRL